MDFSADPMRLMLTKILFFCIPLRGARPPEHLVFGEGGTVVPRDGSLRGLASIRVYALDRADLRAHRAQAQDAAPALLLMAVSKVVLKQDSNAVRALIAGLREGRHDYSVAVLSAIRVFTARDCWPDDE